MECCSRNNFEKTFLTPLGTQFPNKGNTIQWVTWCHQILSRTHLCYWGVLLESWWQAKTHILNEKIGNYLKYYLLAVLTYILEGL